MDEYVEVVINNAHDIQHYEKLGYQLPKEYDKYNKKYVTHYGTIISVKLQDTQDHWLIGKQFGHLTVIGYDYKKSEIKHKTQRYRYWICQCDCQSNPKSIRQKDLLDGTIVSCGKCSNNHSKLSAETLNKYDEHDYNIPLTYIPKPKKDLTGMVFGKLTVVKQDIETPQKPDKNGYFKVRWWCRCSCGNPELKSILGGHLTSHKIESCGCLWMKSISGENNWNWKGGITPEDRLFRGKEEYVNWRYNVFKRDNFHCQCCGKIGMLNAHHILDYNNYKDLRLNIDNGISLCEECHAISCEGSFHNLYGTYDTTPDQLREYILNKSGIDIYVTHPEILSLTQQND